MRRLLWIWPFFATGLRSVTLAFAPMVSQSTSAGISFCKTSRPTATELFMHNKKKRGGGGGGGGFASAAMQSLATKTFPYAGPLRPGKQSPQRVVLDENVLVKPDYWQTGTPSRASKPLLPWMIEVKSADEIAKMRKSGALARHVLDMAGRMVRAGITTDAIDARVHEEIIAVRLDNFVSRNTGIPVYRYIYIYTLAFCSFERDL
jgi:hypothetical protein